MTLEQFIAHCRGLEFRKTDFTGLIRTKKYQECPVCAVANKLVGEKKFRLNYISAAAAIDLPLDLAGVIATCADFPYKAIGDYAKVRTELEALCS